MSRLCVIGASGHGRVVADAAALSGWDEVVFLDDAPGVTECGGFPVVGRAADAGRVRADGYVVAIGNAETRRRVQERLEADGLSVATLVHPSAVVAEGVALGVGTVVLAGAVVNPGAVLGRGCIVNTCASVDHDCRVGDFCHVSVGAHLAGTVCLGDGVWAGIGAVVSNNLTVCPGCTLGAGTVVVSDLSVPGTYIGVPAKMIER